MVLERLYERLCSSVKATLVVNSILEDLDLAGIPFDLECMQVLAQVGSRLCVALVRKI